jgi:hypothetical protein
MARATAGTWAGDDEAGRAADDKAGLDTWGANLAEVKAKLTAPQTGVSSVG